MFPDRRDRTKTDGAESAAEAAVKKCWKEGEPQMITETDGIILKQTRLPDDRRILVLFTRKFGKISAGTSIQLNGKNKSSLALRVFTHGRYELFFGGKSCNVNAAETLDSYFKIGEDIDKYMLASYILEFTDRLIMENQPNEKLFELLVEFLRLLERRKTKPESLILIYQWKALDTCGFMPGLDGCVRCGAPVTPPQGSFSVADGGLICEDCGNSGSVNKRLLYNMEFDIIRILKSIRDNEISVFENLALNDGIYDCLKSILRDYISYHLDINKLKSESYLI